MSWWNQHYLFRRGLTICNNNEDVESGHSIQWDFDFLGQYDSGKLREDYEDVEVVYNTDASTPSYVVLSREVSDDNVRFFLPTYLDKGDCIEGQIYIYFGNWDLNDQDDRPEYEEDLWTSIKEPDDINVAYTRPEEYWSDGRASNKNAVATITFYGSKLRINSIKDLDQGIMQVSIDGSDWEEVDLFNATTSEEVVYSVTNLSEGKHKLQIKAAGKSSPMASSNEINFSSIEYLTPVDIENGGEEIFNVDWASVVSGAL